MWRKMRKNRFWGVVVMVDGKTKKDEAKEKQCMEAMVVLPRKGGKEKRGKGKFWGRWCKTGTKESEEKQTLDKVVGEKTKKS